MEDKCFLLAERNAQPAPTAERTIKDEFFNPFGLFNLECTSWAYSLAQRAEVAGLVDNESMIDQPRQGLPVGRGSLFQQMFFDLDPGGYSPAGSGCRSGTVCVKTELGTNRLI